MTNSRDIDADPQWVAIQERETNRENLRFEFLFLADVYGISLDEMAVELSCLVEIVKRRNVSENYRCLDCSMDVDGQEYGNVHEYYNVHDDVWEQSGLGPDDGMLCLACLEGRIGRELKSDDFGNCLINTHPLYSRSERFTNRLNRK